MVQNLSHPHTLSGPIFSINHHLNSNLFPCTWGTFLNMCLLIWSSLPALRQPAEMSLRPTERYPLLPHNGQAQS
jgi:hypothetical protein